MVTKPTEKEEEFFARQEFDRKKILEQEKQKALVEEEKKEAKDLHYMKCPKCGMDLIEIGYKNIRVDKCSACEGVWLDSGELEQVAKLDKGGLDKVFSVFRR